MKSDYKMAYAAYNREVMKMGGGPAPPYPPQKFKIIKRILPDELISDLSGCDRYSVNNDHNNKAWYHVISIPTSIHNS